MIAPDRTALEVRVPIRTHKGWRWDVTKYRLTDPVHPGVYDGRQHLDSSFGYTRTRWGAWRAIRRVTS